MSCNHNCRPCRCGEADGEALKGAALTLLAERREVFVRRGRRALLDALLCAGTATADEVREAVELPPGMNPKLFGIVPGPLAHCGIIRQVGFAKTCRPVGHARPVAVWELADHAAAVRWLRDHPNLADPAGADQGDGSQGVLFPIHTTNEPTPAVAAAGAVKK
jgi:hypothetical protein